MQGVYQAFKRLWRVVTVGLCIQFAGDDSLFVWNNPELREVWEPELSFTDLIACVIYGGGGAETHPNTYTPDVFSKTSNSLMT